MVNSDKRKELVEQYQERKRAMGVYRILHVPSGRALIGSSLNLEAAWNREQFSLNFGNHPCKPLQEAWKRDGEAAFRYEIVEALKTEDDVRFDYKDFIKLDGTQRSASKKYRDAIEALEATCIELARHEGALLYNE